MPSRIAVCHRCPGALDSGVTADNACGLRCSKLSIRDISSRISQVQDWPVSDTCHCAMPVIRAAENLIASSVPAHASGVAGNVA